MKPANLLVLATLMMFVGIPQRDIQLTSSAPGGSLDDVRQVLLAIRPGLSRADVEAIIQQPDDGPQSSRTTRYVQGPGYLIVVPFDENGGLWSAQNKVNGLPKITVSRWRRASSSKL